MSLFLFDVSKLQAFSANARILMQINVKGKTKIRYSPHSIVNQLFTFTYFSYTIVTIDWL